MGDKGIPFDRLPIRQIPIYTPFVVSKRKDVFVWVVTDVYKGWHLDERNHAPIRMLCTITRTTSEHHIVFPVCRKLRLKLCPPPQHSVVAKEKKGTILTHINVLTQGKKGFLYQDEDRWSGKPVGLFKVVKPAESVGGAHHAPILAIAAD